MRFVTTTCALCVASFVVFKLMWQKHASEEKKYDAKDSHIKVSRLFIYPIKACAGIAVSQINITPKGIQYDREYCVVQLNTKTNEYKKIAQNNNPKLCLITSTVPNGEEIVDLNAPNMQTLSFKITETDSSIMDINYEYSDRELKARAIIKVKCYDQGKEVSQWLTKYLNDDDKDLRESIKGDESKDSNNSSGDAKKQKIYKLVKKCAINDRHIAKTSKPGVPKIKTKTKTEDTDEIGKNYYINMQDSHPMMITSQESMDKLQNNLRSHYSENDYKKLNLGFERFRPNIVLKGTPFAHFEDEIESFQILNDKNNATYYFGTHNARCPVPQIDQTNGKRGMEPKRTLMYYRKGETLGKLVSKEYLLMPNWKDKVFFGSLFAIDKSCTLNVGDAVTSLSVRTLPKSE